MNDPRTYVGIDKDLKGGMTDTAKIIRDAWVFGLIPETETCAGWRTEAIEALWEKVDAQWGKYGFRVAALPEDLRAKFMSIQGEAMTRAKAAGWSGEQELADDS
jgi:hypothetical protein